MLSVAFLNLGRCRRGETDCPSTIVNVGPDEGASVKSRLHSSRPRSKSVPETIVTNTNGDMTDGPGEATPMRRRLFSHSKSISETIITKTNGDMDGIDGPGESTPMRRRLFSRSRTFRKSTKGRTDLTKINGGAGEVDEGVDNVPYYVTLYKSGRCKWSLLCCPALLRSSCTTGWPY